jgi:hypothetical protein
MTREAKSSGEEGIQRVGGKATDARKREREMDAIEMGSIAKHVDQDILPTKICWVQTKISCPDRDILGPTLDIYRIWT